MALRLLDTSADELQSSYAGIQTQNKPEPNVPSDIKTYSIKAASDVLPGLRLLSEKDVSYEPAPTYKAKSKLTAGDLFKIANLGFKAAFPTYGVVSTGKQLLVGEALGEKPPSTEQLAFGNRSLTEIPGFSKSVAAPGREMAATAGRLLYNIPEPISRLGLAKIPDQVFGTIADVATDIASLNVASLLKKGLHPTELFNNAWQRTIEHPDFQAAINKAKTIGATEPEIKAFVDGIRVKAAKAFADKGYLSQLNLGLGKGGFAKIGKGAPGAIPEDANKPIITPGLPSLPEPIPTLLKPEITPVIAPETAKTPIVETPTEGGKVENLPKIETLWQPSNKVDAPYEGKFEEGKRYIDSIGEDPYIYETQYIDPKSLLEDLNMEGVSYQGVVDMPTTQKYIEWYKQGKMPPPVGIVKGWNDGKNVSTNRRRIIAAIEAGVEKIPAYIEIGRKSKLSPTEGGKVLTKDEFKNLDFKHPEGGSSKTPKTVMNWKREDYETLLDLAKQEDTFRFDEAIGKNEKFTGIKSSAKLKDKILKNEPIIIYRAVPINEKQTLLPGAYVTESLEYAKRHGDLIIKGGTKEDYEILKETVKPDELMTYGDPHEFIYIPESVDVGYEKYLKASKLSPTEGGKVRTFDTAKGSMLIKTKDGVIHQGRDSMHAIMLERLGISPNDVVDTGIVSNGRAIWLKSKGDKLSPTEGKK